MKKAESNRPQKIRSLLLHEVAIYFTQNWARDEKILTLFDVILSSDQEEARFLFTINDELKDSKILYNEVNRILQESRKVLFKKTDLKRLPKFTLLLSDNSAMKGLEDEII